MLVKNYFAIKNYSIKVGCHPKLMFPIKLKKLSMVAYASFYDDEILILTANKILDGKKFVATLDELKHPTKGFRENKKSYQISKSGEDYYVKLLYRNSPFMILADMVRLAKLNRSHTGVYGELIHTAFAKEAGLPVTDIRVYAESKVRLLRPRRSALIISHIPKGAQSVTKLLRHSPEVFESITDELILLIIRCWKSGVIHNDLHPGNIILCPNRGLYIIDWESIYVSSSPSKELLSYIFGYFLSIRTLQTKKTSYDFFLRQLRNSLGRIFGVSIAKQMMLDIENWKKNIGNWKKGSIGCGLYKRLSIIKEIERVN